MTLTPTAFPRTAATAARLEIVERTGSTNADLVAGAPDAAQSWPHLGVILTDDQSAGRGRLGRSWTAAPGSALAISVLLRADALAASARGWIPLLAGVAMARAVGAQLTDRVVKVKWPNDVLVDGLKISGILAEAVAGADAVVVGAGVNTAMAASDLPVPTAVSFAAVGREADVDALAADYLAELSSLFDALVDAGGDAEAAGIRAAVAAQCATLETAVKVHLPGGGELVGTAVRIGSDGELVVRTREGETSVTAGDVVHVR